MSAQPDNLFGGAANDGDSQETREWIDALSAVVASDLDAFRRVLAGGSGVLFPTGDADALAVTVAGLLDDPDARSALVERAARVVTRFDWAVLAHRVLEVYASAIEVHAAGSARRA
jgi:phosphatidylinositol alpha-mannosyltransferase